MRRLVDVNLATANDAQRLPFFLKQLDSLKYYAPATVIDRNAEGHLSRTPLSRHDP